MLALLGCVAMAHCPCPRRPFSRSSERARRVPRPAPSLGTTPAPKRAHAQLALVDKAQALGTSHTWLAP